MGPPIHPVNHTLLTVESIQARGLVCAGIFLNQARQPTADDEIAIQTNRTVLEQTAGVPVLGVVTHGQAALEIPASLSAPPVPARAG